jgi:hypothetical protein
MKNINTLSENQQRIINSLVNEFEKINQPTFISNGGLVDWSKINQDKNEWEQTKREVEISNDVMRKFIRQTIEDTDAKIRESLGHIFTIETKLWDRIESGCNWKFFHHKSIDKAFSVSLDVKTSHTYSKCGNFSVESIENIGFGTYAGNPNRELKWDTIEGLFQHERVINTIKRYV